jgi:uncharacterized protein YbcI
MDFEARPPPGDEPAGALGEPHVSKLAETSRAMVRLYKELFGRGPVKARSNWAGDDILVCTLEDTLTPAERNLRELGEDQRLRDMRMFFQYATVPDFVNPIEEITGRTVRSFISGLDTQEDVALETFIFYPRGSEGRSRAEVGEG